MKMRLLAVLFVFVPFVAFCGGNNAGKPGGNNNNVTAYSEKAPDFTLKSIDGKTIKLSNYKGKIVIIDFWATWCPPCRKGIPDLIEIQKEYSKDVVVLGISVDRETAKDVPGFVKNNKINYTVALFNENIIKSYGGINSIPTSFVIDRQGNIVKKLVGLQDKSTYTDLLKSLKAKK
jgi:cytochrome c biogenesis protein CcmG/thiol:disulfide interchange protein DsbE